MQSKKMIIGMSAFMFLVLASPALAVETTPTGIRKEIKQDIREVKKNYIEDKKAINTLYRTEKQELKTENKTEIAELKSKRINALYRAIRNELTKKYDLMNKIKAKIEVRINERAAQGKDMTAAKTKLAEFSKFETAYETDLTTFDTKFNELAASKSQASLVAGLKLAANKVKTDLTSMHKVLLDTLRLVMQAK